MSPTSRFTGGNPYAPSSGVDEESWKDLGLCRETDPDLWFPEKGESARPAKRMCRQCDVQVECLRYAIANDERFGIWGGLTERERRRPGSETTVAAVLGDSDEVTHAA